MQILYEYRKEIAKAVNRALGEELVNASHLVYPPGEGMGDLSLPCFVFAKTRGMSPAGLVGDLISRIERPKIVAGVKAAGPYLNFTLDSGLSAVQAIGEIENKGTDYGFSLVGENKKILLEYSNANTHKEYHIGHLRNAIYGDTVTRILNANGYKAIPVSYINDFGIHVAKTLWAYISFYKEEPPAEKKGEFLASVYVRSGAEAEKDSGAKGKIEFIMKKIESRQGKEYELWRKTREWSIEQFSRIYEELGLAFDYIFYESEYIDQGKAMIPELLEKGILKESQGAVIADLEKYGLGVLVVLRSDGTATYPVADIPLAEAKAERFSPDTSIWVVDDRQSLYFRQLFKILKLVGRQEEMIHLKYDFVKLPSGMMASRTGNVVTYSQLKEAMFLSAMRETRARHKDWDDNKIVSVAETLAFGAMKFEMIKVGADQVISFDIGKALSFTGYTAAYIQYAYARAKSILRKNDESLLTADLSSLKEKKEHDLVMMLLKYPETIVSAGTNYDPSQIAHYIFDLASIFNDYYHDIPVLKAEANLRLARLRLLQAVASTLDNGLRLLGIKSIEEM